MQRKIINIVSILYICVFVGAAFSQPSGSSHGNESDSRAIEIAENVMRALGGRESWNDTHYVSWNFFGRRLHIWDKWSGNLRLEDGNLITLMNVNTREGRVWQNGEKVTDPDSLQKKLQNAYAKWINDSYWMFMPYKLRDPGVNLHYVGEGITLEGDSAEILQLTFENVGLTPENKYHVYVDAKSNLVIQFDYYKNASDDEPAIQAPWKNWKRYGNILLSDDRGTNRKKMTEIAVFDNLHESVFSDNQPIDIQQLINTKEKR